MVSRTFVSVLLALLALAGCATMQPQPKQVMLTSPPVASPQQRVGVAIAAMPKPGVAIRGADCLLCYATATAANSGIAKHAEALGVDDFRPVKEKIASTLRAKGMNVVVIADEFDLEALATAAESPSSSDMPKKDFRPLASRYGIDKLLLVQVQTLGFERLYSAYIPRGEPRAVLNATGHFINLSTNRYEWFLPVHQSGVSQGGRWDEPEKNYPGLTNAYYQVIELGKDRLVESLR